MDKQYRIRDLTKNKGLLGDNIIFMGFCLPAIVLTILFHWIPLYGIVLAFKDFKYPLGIAGSPWIGFDNFKYIFLNDDIYRILRNTIGYSIATLLLMNILFGIIVALLLYEVTNKAAFKIYQTSMLLPYFVSWTIISYIGLILFNPKSGLLNQLITFFGGTPISWYNEAKYWPFIIMIFVIWKTVGMASLYYYAALLNIDPCLFEAANLDGAGKLKQIWYISLPELKPMVAMTLIMQMGNILNQGMDLYYNLTLNSTSLYSTTDVLGTYIYRGMVSGPSSIGPTAAVGLFQSVVGFVLVMVTNGIVKKMDEKSAMF